MKKIIPITLLLSSLFLGCGGGSSSNKEESSSTETTTINKSFDNSLRGEWIYIYDNKKVYIDDTFEHTIRKIDDNLIQVTKDDLTYYLMRFGTNTTTVKGNLYDDSSLNSSISKAISRVSSRIGSMNVILKHYKDSDNNKEQKLENDTSFEFDNVQSGEYTLIASTEDVNNPLSVSSKVYIEGEEISLGGFKLVSDDGYNFKTEFSIENSQNGYLFGNQTVYSGKMIIKNIGNKEGTGLNYSFTSDSPYIASMHNEIILGTVEVNSSIKIPFDITFNILDKTKVDIPINVTITDALNHKWYDTVFLHVYQTPMHLNIATKEANVKGYIIDDGHNVKQIDTGTSTIILPYKAGESYYLVLSSPNKNDETPYSIALDTDTMDFSTFQNTGIYEPNDKESEATTLKVGESLISYLHKGDIDYFKLDMTTSLDNGLFSPPQMPFK
jgi:hypothetical protein